MTPRQYDEIARYIYAHQPAVQHTDPWIAFAVLVAIIAAFALYAVITDKRTTRL